MKKFIKQIWPRSPLFDYVYHLLIFLIDFHRLPSRRAGRFCDMIFFEKISTSDLFLKAFLTDKEYFKMFVRDRFGSDLVPQTFFSGLIDESLRDRNFPARCCIKPTHTSGQVIFRLQDESVDFEKILGWLNDRLYDRTREPNYRYLKSKYIVEELVFDNVAPTDYKFFVFNGTPRLIQVDIDRFGDHRRDFYDVYWKKLALSLKYENSTVLMTKPKKFAAMLDIAGVFGQLFKFVRVDFYVSQEGRFQLGECTFFPDNGRYDFIGKDSEILNWIK